MDGVTTAREAVARVAEETGVVAKAEVAMVGAASEAAVMAAAETAAEARVAVVMVAVATMAAEATATVSGEGATRILTRKSDEGQPSGPEAAGRAEDR